VKLSIQHTCYPGVTVYNCDLPFVLRTSLFKDINTLSGICWVPWQSLMNLDIWFSYYTSILLLLLLLLRWLYSPMRTFTSLMDFFQSSVQSSWLFRGHILGFLTVDFFRGGVVIPTPNPQPEDQVSVFISPGEWVAQLYPQAPSTHFSRLLRHAWLQWDYSFPRSPHGGYTSITMYYL
jgi:hypothetical protein